MPYALILTQSSPKRLPGGLTFVSFYLLTIIYRFGLCGRLFIELHLIQLRHSNEERHNEGYNQEQSNKRKYHKGDRTMKNIATKNIQQRIQQGPQQ
jgi:hypothetical protein